MSSAATNLAGHLDPGARDDVPAVLAVSQTPCTETDTVVP